VTAPDTDPAPTLGQLVDERSILVCCGSGGVGKTTTAAVLALEAAVAGRLIEARGAGRSSLLPVDGDG
jgi:Mrp family chromosome partitioning ATPase